MVEGGFGVVMLHFQKIPRGEKEKGKRKGVRYPPPPPSSHPSEQTPLSNAWREKERDVSREWESYVVCEKVFTGICADRIIAMRQHDPLRME